MYDVRACVYIMCTCACNLYTCIRVCVSTLYSVCVMKLRRGFSISLFCLQWQVAFTEEDDREERESSDGEGETEMGDNRGRTASYQTSWQNVVSSPLELSAYMWIVEQLNIDSTVMLTQTSMYSSVQRSLELYELSR